MTDDIWTHTARDLRNEEERLRNALRDAVEAQRILEVMQTHYRWKRVTGAQIERWCAAYQRDGEPGLRPTPQTCKQPNRTPEQRAKMSVAADRKSVV